LVGHVEKRSCLTPIASLATLPAAWICNRLAMLAMIAAGSLGCARLQYRAEHKQAIKDTTSQRHRGDIYFDKALGRVEIVTQLEPTGFSYDKVAMRMNAGAESGHEVLQYISIEFPTMENPARVLWFGDYAPHQRWRRGLCYWQVPIMWVTLGIWHLVPVYYPCIPAIWHTGALREVAGEEKRIAILRSALQAEACRLGGTAVIGVAIDDGGAAGWVVRRAGEARCEVAQVSGGRKPTYRVVK
jgi:hypothetical protein